MSVFMLLSIIFSAGITEPCGRRILSVTPDLARNIVQALQTIREEVTQGLGPKEFLYYRTFLKQLLTSKEMKVGSENCAAVALPSLSISTLFENPEVLPTVFLSGIEEKCLPYLSRFGLTSAVVESHFKKNIERIKKHPMDIDASSGVGICHLLAATHKMLLDRYLEEDKIPFHVKAYFSLCLMLRDHAETPKGPDSFFFLHHPEHSRTLRNEREFPIPNFLLPNKRRIVNLHDFFTRIRAIVACKAIEEAHKGACRPRVREDFVVSGIHLPKIDHFSSMDRFFGLVEQHKMSYVVELVHISGTTDQPKLFCETRPGIFSSQGNLTKDTPIKLFIQIYTIGLSDIEREGMIDQLRQFEILKLAIMRMVCNMKEHNSLKSPDNELQYTSASGIRVDGWLRNIFDPAGGRFVLLDERFGKNVVLSKIGENAKGIAPRHMYLSTDEDYASKRVRDEK